MGSIITLGVDRLEIDWGKNSFFRNHSRLFLPDDKGMAPYHYVDDDYEEPIVEEKAAFVRPLFKVVRRLDLLGYSLSECRRKYDELLAEMPDYYSQPMVDYDTFSKAVATADPGLVRLRDSGEDCDPGEYVVENILLDSEFTKTSTAFAQMRRDAGEFFENLDPYITLRLLASNPANLDRLLIWRFADVVEGGWVKEDDVYQDIATSDKYLIVTEGSSDAFILKKSLPCVAPDVADFFDFVDMTENYPFTGTGNLVKFCQGLAKIKIQNRILVVLDNDTAGRSALAQISQLSLPSTMKLMSLPRLTEFESICTLGPAGGQREDVNGRAVAIESFLDLGFQREAEPEIRWTSFDKRMNEYQGELVGKELYVKKFKESIGRSNGYNLGKLEYLWAKILETCGCDV